MFIRCEKIVVSKLSWVFSLLLMLPMRTFAQTGGLQRAEGALQTLLDNLYIILPIAAIIVGVVIGKIMYKLYIILPIAAIIVGVVIAVLYAAEVMRKDDAVRWMIGVVLAGSAAEIVALLWR